MNHLTHICLNAIYKYCNSTTQQILRNTYKFFDRYPIKKLSFIELISDCNDNVEIIKWACMNGYLMDKMTCTYVASYGYLNILKYLHNHEVPWNEKTCENAGRNGNLDCLKYAHKNGCPWNEYTCAHTAAYGHLDCLKYAHENGCPWDNETCVNAAASGRLDCLKYAHENGCPWYEDTCSAARFFGNLDCLKYAYENGCPWYEELSKDIEKIDPFNSFAVERSKKYDHENGL